MSRKGITAVGACYLDTILTVPQFPVEDGKLRASGLEKRRGGNVPNALEVMQQLFQARGSSVPLLLISVLPAKSSSAAEEVQSSFGVGVDLSHSIHRDPYTEAPSSYIIRSLANNTRTIVNYNELAEMTIDEFIRVADRVAERSQLFHFEGRNPDVTLKCIRYLRDNYKHVNISVEVEKPNRSGLEDLAAEADIIFHSRSWAESRGYYSAEQCVRGQSERYPKAAFLFCTWGAQGATALKLPEMIIHSSAALAIEPGERIRDTIGAGDTFIAGVLYALTSESWELETTLQFANELAGRKVLQDGFGNITKDMERWLQD